MMINFCNYWFSFEDSYWAISKKDLYQEIYKLIPEELKDVKILDYPNEEEIIEELRKKEDCLNNIIVISNRKPFESIKNLFIFKKIKNKFGILTTQDKEIGITEEKALELELGLSVMKSPFTLDDIGGAEKLKKFTNELIKAEKKGYKAKGIFLVGIPGTGKTFFPKCFAGQLDRKLILLNLSQIMESDEPITKLNEIFLFLNTRNNEYPDEKYVILIDEIEKMIGNATSKEKQMLGRLLTILNDINTPACEYSFNAIFFATANDLNSILENNPEFLRRGRWDELFFISLPTIESAKEMFEIYIRKYKLESILEIKSLESIISEIEEKYQKENPLSSKFPYTPAEIETLCKRIDFARKAYEDDLEETHISECIDLIIPLAHSARLGIEKMSAQAKLFIEI